MYFPCGVDNVLVYVNVNILLFGFYLNVDLLISFLGNIYEGNEGRFLAIAINCLV